MKSFNTVFVKGDGTVIQRANITQAESAERLRTHLANRHKCEVRIIEQLPLFDKPVFKSEQTGT